ncbi:MAG: permease-like cell division protein FtsX [candidate division Zixibacteria bacterium]
MIRINYILREVLRNLGRNFGAAASSLLSLTLLFLLFNLFWVAAGSSDRFYNDLLSDLRMEAFLDDGPTDSALVSVKRELFAIDGVLSADYISRDQAREVLADQLGIDLLIGYDTLNPLPRSYLLSLGSEALNSTDLERIETSLRDIPVVTDVQYGRRFVDKAESSRELIRQVGFVLGLLILLAALISSSNNIRLMARARAVGFQQMLLQGAGKIFIGLPFVIEGFLIAGIAAILSWGIILYGQSRVAFTQFEIILPTTEDQLIFCLIAAAVGGISGYLGIRKMMK